jgi:hypothetical protein
MYGHLVLATRVLILAHPECHLNVEPIFTGLMDIMEWRSQLSLNQVEQLRIQRQENLNLDVVHAIQRLRGGS